MTIRNEMLLSQSTTKHQLTSRSMKNDATNGAGTAYPSGAHEFTPDFSGVRVTRSLVLCACFVDVCTFSFGHCVVCPSSTNIF